MKWIHWIFSVLFAISALLQYNDPDPVRWAALYASAAVAAGCMAGGRPQPLLMAAVAGACASWMTFEWYSIVAFARRGDWGLLAATMKAGEPLIEESREFLGLAVVLAWCVATLVAARRSRGA